MTFLKLSSICKDVAWWNDDDGVSTGQYELNECENEMGVTTAMMIRKKQHLLCFIQ